MALNVKEIENLPIKAKAVITLLRPKEKQRKTKGINN